MVLGVFFQNNKWFQMVSANVFSWLQMVSDGFVLLKKGLKEKYRLVTILWSFETIQIISKSKELFANN